MVTAVSVILLVEHDSSVRRLTRTTLEENGFSVLEASGGLEAMAVMLSHEGEIALAIVEITMPGVSGFDFANQLVIDRPKTQILYVSASQGSVAADSISLRKPESILSMPFTAGELVNRVRRLLTTEKASRRSRPPRSPSGGTNSA